MLFAETSEWSVQEYLLLIGVLAALIERSAAWYELYLTRRTARLREEDKIVRDQLAEEAKIERERVSEEKTAKKLEAVRDTLTETTREVKDTLTETTRVQEEAATKREEKLDAVAKVQVELVKQTDGMLTAIKKGSVNEGRLLELDKMASEVHDVRTTVNGDHNKLDDIKKETSEIKTDTGKLVGEMAEDIKTVKKQTE